MKGVQPDCSNDWTPNPTSIASHFKGFAMLLHSRLRLGLAARQIRHAVALLPAMSGFRNGPGSTEDHRGVPYPNTPWDWHICPHWGGLGGECRHKPRNRGVSHILQILADEEQADIRMSVP